MFQSKRSGKRMLFVLTGLSLSVLSVARANGESQESDPLKAYFPAQCQAVDIARGKPVDQATRNYLHKFGVSDKAIDLYGSVAATNYFCKGFTWSDVKPDALGPEKITYDTTGMRKLSPEPAPGVHPRLFFTDADRPAERDRLLHTKGGQAAYKILMAYTHLLKGTYDRNADYAQPDTFHGSFGVHGFLPLFRAGSGGASHKAVWQAYSQGKTLPTVKGKPAPRLDLGLCALEAYRCWLDQDSTGAKLVATATQTFLQQKLATLKAGAKPKPRFNLDYIYDFIYNWLTPEQKELFRGYIIASTFDDNNYGCFQNAISSRSNWASFDYRFMSWAAIHGDPGSNPMQYLSYVRGMKNFLTYGWFKAGSCWEGLGKNQVGGAMILAMTRNGDDLAGHPHLRAYLDNFLPKDILPWGDHYMAYDALGGERPLNAEDIVPLHYLYPNSKIIDWVYRNTVHDDYSFMYGDGTRVSGWGNNALMFVLFMNSYDKNNDNPAKLGISKTFFDGQRGLMITRSDWTSDAMYMHLQCRGASGGHVNSDRNGIVVAGAGKLWFTLNGTWSQETYENSVVDIDGRTIPADAPGKVVAFKNKPVATFVSGDASYAWNHDFGHYAWSVDTKGKPVAMNQWDLSTLPTLKQVKEGKVSPPPGWNWVKQSFNEFAYTKQDTKNFTMPIYLHPDWLIPNHSCGALARPSKLQVKDAYRTAGIVRGKFPYMLVLDNYNVGDNEDHDYSWYGHLNTGVHIWKVRNYAMKAGRARARRFIKKGDYVFHDIYLVPGNSKVNSASQKPDKGTPVLLIRFLEKDHSQSWIHGHDWGGASIVYGTDGIRRLKVKTVRPVGDFKALLYTYHYGEQPLPTTRWSEDGKTLSVNFLKGQSEQHDELTFDQTSTGRPGFSLKRVAGRSGATQFQY